MLSSPCPQVRTLAGLGWLQKAQTQVLIAACLLTRCEAMIKFVLMVNKMGQTRVSSYYDWMPIPERVALEAEVVRRCFSRSELQCSFFEFRGYKIIYRRVSCMSVAQGLLMMLTLICHMLWRNGFIFLHVIAKGLICPSPSLAVQANFGVLYKACLAMLFA